jgi:hypothetical protein
VAVARGNKGYGKFEDNAYVVGCKSDHPHESESDEPSA